MRNLILVACACFFFGIVNGQEPTKAEPVRDPKSSESQTYRPRELTSSRDVGKKQRVQKETVKAQPGATPVVSENKPVSLSVSIVDLHGKPVSGLTKDNFKLFIDGQQSEIGSVTAISEPINIIFLIDASPSADVEKKEVRSMAQHVLGQLTPGDRAMVIKFDSDVEVLCKLTDDLKAAEKAIRKASESYGNGTGLYNAIQYLSEKIIPPLGERTAVILFTDGVDTTSRRAKYDTSLALAENIDAVFYTVYFDTLPMAVASSRRVAGLGMPTLPGVTPLEYAIGINYINDLATMSGGRAARAKTLVGSTTALFGSIPSEVRNRYTVKFTPQGERPVGQRQEIKVRVDRANLAVLARGSYIVR